MTTVMTNLRTAHRQEGSTASVRTHLVAKSARVTRTLRPDEQDPPSSGVEVPVSYTHLTLPTSDLV